MKGISFIPRGSVGSGTGDMLAANNLSDLINKPTALTNLGGTTLGVNLFKIANPGAITFPRFDADNTASALSASDFRTAIGAGTSSFNGAYASLSGAPSLGTAAALNAGLNLGDAVVRVGLPSSPGTPSIAFFSTGRTTYLWDDGAPGPDNEVQLPATSGQLALTSQIPSLAPYAHLAGDTFSGLIQFSGTGHAGIKMINLTTAQKNALTAAAGMVVFDTDLARFQSYSGAAWVSHVRLTGDTMTGLLTLNASTGLAIPGSTSGIATLLAPAIAGTSTITLPGVTSTLAILGANTFTGVQAFTAGSAGAPAITAAGDTDTGIYFSAANTIDFATAGLKRWTIDSNGTLQGGGNSYQTTGNTIGVYFFARGGYYAMGAGDDTISQREAAQHWTHRNGAIAQILSVANKWTSTTNFERFKIDWSATTDVCRIGTSKGSGGGLACALQIEVGDVAAIKISTAGLLDFAASVANTDAAAVSTHSVPISVAGTIYNFLVRT